MYVYVVLAAKGTHFDDPVLMTTSNYQHAIDFCIDTIKDFHVGLDQHWDSSQSFHDEIDSLGKEEFYERYHNLLANGGPTIHKKTLL